MSYRNDDDVYSLNNAHQDIDLNGCTNWNLRSNLKYPVSMTQIGSGNGNKITVGYEHSVSGFSGLSLVFSRYNYADSGTHMHFIYSQVTRSKVKQS
jgi:hypothetical protein